MMLRNQILVHPYLGQFLGHFEVCHERSEDVFTLVEI